MPESNVSTGTGHLPPSDDARRTPEVTAVSDWLAEGERLFGKDWRGWKFECPVCHHVQTPGDFEAKGDDPQHAYSMCIGRLLPKGHRAFNLGGTPAPDTGAKSPCDFAAFGLFSIGTRMVQGDSGKPQHVFPFASVQSQSSEDPAPAVRDKDGL